MIGTIEQDWSLIYPRFTVKVRNYRLIAYFFLRSNMGNGIYTHRSNAVKYCILIVRSYSRKATIKRLRFICKWKLNESTASRGVARGGHGGGVPPDLFWGAGLPPPGF